MKQRHCNGTISIWIEKTFPLHMAKPTYSCSLLQPTDLVCSNVWGLTGIHIIRLFVSALSENYIPSSDFTIFSTNAKASPTSIQLSPFFKDRVNRWMETFLYCRDEMNCGGTGPSVWMLCNIGSLVGQGALCGISNSDNLFTTCCRGWCDLRRRCL